MERGEIVVRRAREEDAGPLAAVIVDALADKYRPALGTAAVRGAAAVMAATIRSGRDSHCWVAEIDGRIAGGVHLAVGDGRDGEPAQALVQAVGRLRALRAALVFSAIGAGRIAGDEAYIDELGVAPWARRRGVARALLATCEAEARRLGRRRLTLWVTVGNAAALSLYRAAGFRERRRRRWLAGRLLFGAPGAILMELPLADR